MGADPYKYFRVEARELVDGLTQGALEFETGTGDKERVASLLRLAHTLKGAARVVRLPVLAELAHDIEEILSPFRDACAPVPPVQARALLGLLDQIGAGLAALGPNPAWRLASKVGAAAHEEPPETVRVDVEDVDVLLAHISEVGAELARIQNEATVLTQARRQASLLVRQLRLHKEDASGAAAARILTPAEDLLESLQNLDRNLGTGLERLTRDISVARGLASRLRLLRASAIFPALERTVRDAAVALGRSVQLHPSGGDIRLDAHPLTILRDALLQLVRNAVAHGIEDPERRTAAGKPACGRIDLKVERRGDRIAFLCSDDGAGIDLEAIRRVALKKGLILPASVAGLGLPEAIDLIFRGGVSTAGTVSEFSGRGIGLDIVRAAVARLKADMSVQTTPGRGTSIEICVPVSLASVRALTVDSEGVLTSIPLDGVRETLRIERRQIVRCGAQEAIAYQGRAIPFLPLSRALSAKRSPANRREHWSAVIVSAAGEMAAVGVDRLVGGGVLMVRALPELAPATPLIHGVTLDAEGKPQLVLDPAGLLEAVRRGQTVSGTSGAPASPILVVDDSLTTRMVEQSILESAGYSVELAESAEEAFEKARARSYSLFLVDVEMPGVDGFEFVAHIRADPVLRDIPAILVTSRASAEDRRRGAESGARAYIVKSEFDQNHFLQTVQQLLR